MLFLSGCSQDDGQVLRLSNIVYDKQGGQNLHLDFASPKTEGPFPLVVCIHGGGWRAGTRTEYRQFQTQMAKRGIASISIEYRFAPAAKFPAQLNDVRKALDYVIADRERFPIDTSRVFGWVDRPEPIWHCWQAWKRTNATRHV